MAQLLYTGVAGSVDMAEDLLQLSCTVGAAGGSVKIGAQPTINLPANTDFAFIPKQRWYDQTVIFTGTSLYVIEGGDFK